MTRTARCCYGDCTSRLRLNIAVRRWLFHLPNNILEV